MNAACRQCALHSASAGELPTNWRRFTARGVRFDALHSLTFVAINTCRFCGEVLRRCVNRRQMVIVAGGASARDVCSFVAQIATELDIKTRVCGGGEGCLCVHLWHI